MVTTVSLNPSIDKGLVVERFEYGLMNRVVSSREDAGGKAINVARATASLGIQTQCVGFLCRDNGQFIENDLRRHGVEAHSIWLGGRVRTNIKLLDAERNIVTEINEPGVQVDERQLEQMTELIEQLADDSEFLVLTGSLPPRCPPDYYASLIRMLDGSGCRVVLDAEGEPLRAGIEAGPYLVKPNRMELERLLGRPIEDKHAAARAARALVDGGVRYAAVSLGDGGALLADAEAVYFAPALTDIAVRSTVGAGDSMVAGMVAGLLGDVPTEEVLRRGAACAAASITQIGTQMATKAACKQMLENIKTEKVRL